MFIELLIGMLGGTLVALAGRHDEKAARKEDKEVADLLARWRDMADPKKRMSIQATTAVAAFVNEHPEFDRYAPILLTTPQDAQALIGWALAPSEEEQTSGRDDVRSRVLAVFPEDAKPDDAVIDGFLNTLADMANRDLGLTQFRQNLANQEMLRGIATQIDLQKAYGQAILDQGARIEAMVRGLTPHFEHCWEWVRWEPAPHEPFDRERSNLLRGRDAWQGDDAFYDIRHGIDVPREDFDEVIKLVRGRLHEGFTIVPLVGQGRIGKSTLLLRLGWELAHEGCPVARLYQDLQHEDFDQRVPKESDVPAPLVLLVDRAVDARDLVQKLYAIRVRRERAVILFACKPVTWKKVLASMTDEYNLRPWIVPKDGLPEGDPGFHLRPYFVEKERLVDQYVDLNILPQPTPEARAELKEALKRRSDAGAVLNETREFAAEFLNASDRLLAVERVLEERLEADTSDGTDAFRQMYGYVCAAGSLGLFLPKSVAVSLVGQESFDRALAWQRETLRIEAVVASRDGRMLKAVHESVAEDYFQQAAMPSPWEDLARSALADDRLLWWFAWLLVRLAASVGVDTARILVDTYFDEALERATTLEGADAICHRLAATAHSIHDTERAALALRSTLKINPDHASAHYNLGVLLDDRGDLEGAEVAWRAAIRTDPDLAWAHNNLGVLLKGRGDLDGAEAAYREAIRADPDRASAHYNLGGLLNDRGDFEGAEAACREAIRADPGLAVAHTSLSVLLEGRGDREGAEAEWREAIRADPDHAAAHFSLGVLLQDRSDLEGAEAAWREAIRAHPEHAWAHSNLGVLVDDRGDLDGAEAAYREAIRADPDHAAAHSNLGALLMQRASQGAEKARAKFLQEAEEHLAAVEAAEPGKGAYNLACLAAVRGNEEACRRWLMAARQAGTFPDAEFLRDDADLAGMRDRPWFQELLAELEAGDNRTT